jgi:hypothetical protein
MNETMILTTENDNICVTPITPITLLVFFNMGIRLNDERSVRG